MALSVLLIGYGTIAGYVAAKVAEQDGMAITHVLARPGREDAARDVIGGDVRVVTDVAEITGPIDVALECAGHDGLHQHGPAVLARGIDLVVASVGALTDDGLAEDLEQAARDGKAQIDILSGAVGALDAIASARVGGLDSVAYFGRKPPAGWKGSPAEDRCDLDALVDPFTHFVGTAREAARSYPKNANVAAAVALAGMGLDDTAVELVADPAATGNEHVIEAAGAFGTLSFSIVGNPLPGNPRSSSLTAMSAVRALANRRETVRI